MGFECGACNAKTLEIVRAVSIEPDDDSDEASAQIMQCNTCGARALAIYEESRRGRLDHESWRHWAWIVGDDVAAMADERLSATPPPSADRWRAIARGGKVFDVK